MSSFEDSPPVSRPTDLSGSAFPPPALWDTLPRMYGDLRELAASYLLRERPGHTLQPTALVHEAYLRLLGQREIDWENRAQVLGIAAQMMRRILVNHAEARNAAKRGGGVERLPLEAALEQSSGRHASLLALDEALSDLEAMDPRQGQIVELRFFGGLTVEEVAEVLKISEATVNREWASAKLWLRRKVGSGRN